MDRFSSPAAAYTLARPRGAASPSSAVTAAPVASFVAGPAGASPQELEALAARQIRVLLPGTRSKKVADDGRLPLAPADLAQLAHGYATTVLAPLALGEPFAGEKDASFAAWAKASATFGEALLAAIGPGPAWLRGLSYALVPSLLRAREPGARLGLFVDLPFPPFDAFRAQPRRREILEGMLGADVLGFVARGHAEAFAECCRRLLGARVDRYGVIEHHGRRTRPLIAAPGPDVLRITSLAEHPRVLARAEELRDEVGHRKLLVACDPLTASAGILQRLAMLEKLVDQHPEHEKRLRLVQLLSPVPDDTPEARSLRKAVNAAARQVDRAAGAHTVEIVDDPASEAELVAWFRAADAGLFTPVRGGLHAAAATFVAARTDLGGAVVLSEFDAAAEELPQAHCVNPWDAEGFAATVHAALEEDRMAREARMAALNRRVQGADVHAWTGELLRALR